MENPFLGYQLATAEVSGVPPSWLAKHQLSESRALVSDTSRNLMCFPGLSYWSVELCRAHWHAADYEEADAHEKMEVSTVIVPEMDVVELLLEKGNIWTQHVRSIDQRFIDMWEWYRGEFSAHMLSVCSMLFECFTIDREFLPCNILVGTRLRQAESCEWDELTASKAIDKKFTKANSNMLFSATLLPMSVLEVDFIVACCALGDRMCFFVQLSSRCAAVVVRPLWLPVLVYFNLPAGSLSQGNRLFNVPV